MFVFVSSFRQGRGRRKPARYAEMDQDPIDETSEEQQNSDQQQPPSTNKPQTRSETADLEKKKLDSFKFENIIVQLDRLSHLINLSTTHKDCQGYLEVKKESNELI